MVARKAWVISLDLTDLAVHVRAAEEHRQDRSLCRVLMLLKPSTQPSEIREEMRRLNCLLFLTLGEGRESLLHTGRNIDRRHGFINSHTSVVLTLMHGQYALVAHHSTIRVAIEETEHGEYITWLPDTYTIPRIDPHTHHILELIEHPGRERRAKKMELDVQELLLT
jgi:hypothetical protein